MTPEQSWQSLYGHLKAARAALDSGDRQTALEYLNAAFAIDAECLAAHVLRERLQAAEVGLTAVAAPPHPQQPEASREPQQPDSRLEAPDADVPARPKDSNAGYAGFELRVRTRAIEHRVETLRLAIAQGDLGGAETRLDELSRLDPNLPELAEWSAAIAALRTPGAARKRGRGRWVAAACVFAALLLGGSVQHGHLFTGAPATPTPKRDDPTAPRSGVGSSTADAGTVAPAAASDPLLQTNESEPAADPARDTNPPQRFDSRSAPVQSPVESSAAARGQSSAESGVQPALGTAGSSSGVLTTDADTPEAGPSAALRVPPQAPPAVPAVPAPTTAGFAPSETSAANRAPSVLEPSIATVARPAAAAIVDDELLVKQALQRYRRAYEGLDARSASEVYPSVDQPALARAFDSLSSQSLTFDACDVRVDAASATATCRGSAQYVPKIGSREPRTEPRVWNFTLSKTVGDWEIENARVGRPDGP